MILLASERDLPWLPQPNEARFLLTTTLPPAHLSTSALVLAFHGDQLPPSDRCARGPEELAVTSKPTRPPRPRFAANAWKKSARPSAPSPSSPPGNCSSLYPSPPRTATRTRAAISSSTAPRCSPSRHSPRPPSRAVPSSSTRTPPAPYRPGPHFGSLYEAARRARAAYRVHTVPSPHHRHHRPARATLPRMDVDACGDTIRRGRL